jgi:hypothetical protein
MDSFARQIAGALKATINAHGPITEDAVGCATKRIQAPARSATASSAYFTAV